MPLEAEPLDDNFDDANDTDGYDHLYDVPLNVLGLLVRCYNAMRRVGIESVADCIELYNKLQAITITNYTSGIRCLTGEVKDKLIEHGYGIYLHGV